MLFGTHAGEIIAAHLIDIHGTRMLDVRYLLDGEPEPRAARVGLEAVPETLAPGDRVVVHLLMNVVTRIDAESR
jgi:hypothetical protein